MDSLAENHAVIVRDEKTIRIPYGDEVLIVQWVANGGCGGVVVAARWRCGGCVKMVTVVACGQRGEGGGGDRRDDRRLARIWPEIGGAAPKNI
nr:hypothetical protein [Tanacetum cinerariifolium]